MKILVACECSGVVRRAFFKRGHEAWSCDLKPAADGSEFHLQGDVRQWMCANWDMLIAFPDCTYLTNSAAWAFGDGPYHQKVKPGTLTGAERRQARSEALSFVKLLWNSGIDRIAIENPVGSLSTMFMKPSQSIHPYEFGDDASKKTCLWLKGLTMLIKNPANRVAGRLVEWPKGSGKMVERWSNQTDSGQNKLTPSEERSANRAVTYFGVGEAMAEQWGK